MRWNGSIHRCSPGLLSRLEQDMPMGLRPVLTRARVRLATYEVGVLGAHPTASFGCRPRGHPPGQLLVAEARAHRRVAEALGVDHQLVGRVRCLPLLVRPNDLLAAL